MEQFIRFNHQTSQHNILLGHNCDLNLRSPPHSVAIKMEELEDVLGPFSEFSLLLCSKSIIRHEHWMATPSLTPKCVEYIMRYTVLDNRRREKNDRVAVDAVI